MPSCNWASVLEYTGQNLSPDGRTNMFRERPNIRSMTGKPRPQEQLDPITA